MQKKIRYISLHLIFSGLIFLIAIPASTAPWRFKNRLQVGSEWDDNIYESRYASVSGQSFKALFDTRGTRKGGKLAATFQFTGGYQAYPESAEENKLLNDVRGNISYRLARALRLGADGQIKLKFFVNTPWDYATGIGHVWTDIFLPNKFIARVSLGMNGLDYASYNFYDFEGRDASLSLSRQISTSLLMRATVSVQTHDYSRNVLDAQLVNMQLYSSEDNQRDQLRSAGVYLQYIRAFLLTFAYQYQTNESNSYGLSYQRHRWQIFFSHSLPWALLLRCNATYQNKSYDEPLSLIISLEPDTEREESSFVILDISKDILPATALMLRYAWYQNESPLRSLYYQKHVLMLGLDYRF